MLPEKIQEKLLEKDIRVEIDERNEKIGYKIREAQMQKVPYMLVVGEKEVQNNTVGVRSRKQGDIRTNRGKRICRKSSK